MRRANTSPLPAALVAAGAAVLLVACPADESHRRGADGAAVDGDAPAVQSPPPGTAASKRPAGQEGAPPPAWRAFGTEPFWNLRVDGDTLVFSTPEDQAGRRLTGVRGRAADDGLQVRGRDGDTAFALELHPGECSDGMSSRRYAWRATFRLGTRTYEGCAEAAK